MSSEPVTRVPDRERAVYEARAELPRVLHPGDEDDAAMGDLEAFLESLEHRHRLDRFVILPDAARVRVIAAVPSPDSLDEAYHSVRDLQNLAAVEAAFGARLAWTVAVPEATPVLLPLAPGEAADLYLFTHAFDRSSVVCRGETGAPIPLYLLPIDEDLSFRLRTWAASYRAIDGLWLRGGSLERASYRELADVRRPLLSTGRALAAEVERQTRSPTWVYVVRYHAFRTGEEERACPGCGGAWHHPTVAGARGLASHACRCDRCRLLSTDGVSLDGARLARVGAWRGA